MEKLENHFQKHLEIIQDIINRMASNSANCKNFCIALVLALLTYNQVKFAFSIGLLSFVPLLLFLYLDAYYLSLERNFRGIYEELVHNWQNDKLQKKHIYSFFATAKPKKEKEIVAVFKTMKSTAIWPFYSTLFIIVLAVNIFAYTLQ